MIFIKALPYEYLFEILKVKTKSDINQAKLKIPIRGMGKKTKGRLE